ncbi:MAG: M42 family metallopeptidase [Oscillospiraceae bacterium]
MIKTLCEACGIAGQESAIANLIKEEIVNCCKCKIDNVGNVVAFKKGRKAPKHKIMLVAHMDEVGFLVSNIENDGLLKLVKVGGIDTSILVGQTLLVEAKKKFLQGVIGAKPVHLQSRDERCREIDMSSLMLDIGCKTKEEAEKLVYIGTSVYFLSKFEEYGEGLIKSKALDDRVGCAILVELLKTFDECDFYAVFSTMEEVGGRGARMAAEAIKPDIAIVVECTTAADTPVTSEYGKVCCMNMGPAISFMDNVTVYDQKLVELAFKEAERGNLKAQYKKTVCGSNDAAGLHSAGTGIRTLAISVPTRYLHSQAGVVSMLDVEQTVMLLKLIMQSFITGGR